MKRYLGLFGLWATLIFFTGCGTALRIAIISGDLSAVPNGVCTGFTIQLQDGSGSPIVAPSPDGYTLLLFHSRYPDSDPTCAGAEDTGNLTFAAGESDITFYLEKSTGTYSFSSDAMLSDPNNLLSIVSMSTFTFNFTVP